MVADCFLPAEKVSDASHNAIRQGMAALFRSLFWEENRLPEEDGSPWYNFTYADLLFDFILSVGLHPYVELGFVPSKMAKVQYRLFERCSIAGTYASRENWEALVQASVAHWIERYGLEEVLQWRFTILSFNYSQLTQIPMDYTDYLERMRISFCIFCSPFDVWRRNAAWGIGKFWSKSGARRYGSVIFQAILVTKRRGSQKNAQENGQNADMMGYWLLTDFIDEWLVPGGVFHGGYRQERRRISRKAGSAYDKWLEIGAPAKIGPDDLRYLSETSQPSFAVCESDTDGHLVLEAELGPHEVEMIVLQRRDY